MTFKKGYTPHNKGKKGPSGKDHPMYGKKHSEKARLKISLAGKGRKAWNKGKKGQAPWNKGTKGIMKSNSGSFKKGQTSPMKGKKVSAKARKKN